MMMTLLRNYLGTWLVGTIQCTGWGGPGEQVAGERRGPGRLEKVKDLLKAKMSLYMHAKSL